MATHTPTHIIYLALPTKAQKSDGKSTAQWRRIGAVWKNKSRTYEVRGGMTDKANRLLDHF
jgi:hypothetical protein